MSNKTKPQHQGVVAAAAASGLKDPLQPQQPPRYQPPPQPSAGILKSQNGAAAAVLHQQHQQQAARLASQVKDAVQSKFAQKIDLPHHTGQNTRYERGGKCGIFGRSRRRRRERETKISGAFNGFRAHCEICCAGERRERERDDFLRERVRGTCFDVLETTRV